MKSLALTLTLLSSLLVSIPSYGLDLERMLSHCLTLSDDSERLECYDSVARKALEQMLKEDEEVHVGEAEKKPVLIHKVPPVYPKEAKEKGLTGRVVVTALIGKDGSVEQIGKVSGTTIFHESAKQAAIQYRFEPALQDGIPVKVWVSLPFTFRLSLSE